MYLQGDATLSLTDFHRSIQPFLLRLTTFLHYHLVRMRKVFHSPSFRTSSFLPEYLPTILFRKIHKYHLCHVLWVPPPLANH